MIAKVREIWEHRIYYYHPHGNSILSIHKTSRNSCSWETNLTLLKPVCFKHMAPWTNLSVIFSIFCKHPCGCSRILYPWGCPVIPMVSFLPVIPLRRPTYILVWTFSRWLEKDQKLWLQQQCLGKERKQGGTASQLIRHGDKVISCLRITSHLPYHYYYTLNRADKMGRTLTIHRPYTKGRRIGGFCWLGLPQTCSKWVSCNLRIWMNV